MGAPKISVIIPVYNAQDTLPETMDSVLGQSFKDFELICVDDGSTDGSLAILQGYAARDPRVRVLAQANAGAGTARNLGMEQAEGAYLAFLDADDRYEPGMLEAMYARCEEDGAELCVCDARTYHQDSDEFEYPSYYLASEDLPDKRPFSRHDIPDKILMFATCAPWNKLFSRSFVEEHELLFQGTRNSNDVYFGYMALALAERITVCPEVLVTYRKGHGGHIQAAKDSHPLDICTALLALKEGLERAGVWEEVERSFSNRALSCVEYNLRSLNTAEGYLELYSFLKDEGLARLGLLDHEREYYFDRKRHDRVLAIVENAPAIRLFGNAESYADDIRHLNGGVLLDAREVSDLPEGEGVKVSVVMPVYNAEDHVAEAIDSVLAQSLEGFELICVDDGSADGSPAILRGYEARDPRVHVIAQENAGPGAARNAGLRVATGEYVAFLDSDDLLEPEALQTLYAYAKSCDLDELFFSAAEFHEQEKGDAGSDIRPSPAYKETYLGSFSGQDLFIGLVGNGDLRDSVCTQLFRRGFLEDGGIAFREGVVHEDAIFTMECLAVAERVRVLDNPLYRRRIRVGSLMAVSDPFESAYGSFVCGREMIEFVRTHAPNASHAYLEALAENLASRCRLAAEELSRLEDQDVLDRMNALPDDERAGFKSLIFDQVAAVRQEWRGKQAVSRLTARIDVKDGGAPDNDVEVLEASDPDAVVKAPKWLCNQAGSGRVVTSTAGSLDLRLRCHGAGKLSIALRGANVRGEDGERVPVWIDCTSFVVDGGELLQGPRAVWHDKPLRHDLPVKDGQVVEISLSWHSHDEHGIEVERLARAEHEELRARNSELMAVKNSRSYKIGRAITWLPRKIKALIKRIGGGA